MVTPEREPVIENIKKNVRSGDFNAKAELGDPCLTPKERHDILKKYLKVRKTPRFRILNWAAGRAADILTWRYNRNTVITGLENIRDIHQGAIITSNHFNPIENTAIRLLSQKMKKGNLYVVSQDTNLEMKGFFGFFMYYMDIIPVSSDKEYMTRYYENMIKEAFDRGQNVLIYPEQEMWFNYRKPRPGKRGAYFYAAKFHVPVVSCFVEIKDLSEKETEHFYKTQYVLHVLKPIYPDANKSVRDNSIWMQEQDYRQKVEAYEVCYGKKLDYAFEDWDIAGWTGNI